MSHARYRPPDHSKGDESTIGGYMAVHDRPAAFEGSDGFSYSVEIMSEETSDAPGEWGAFLLFIVIVGGGMLTAAFPLMKLILGVVFFGFWVLVILDLTWQREQREQRGKVLLFKK